MEVVNPNALQLSNFEVLNLLKEIKGQQKKNSQSQLATITYETTKYLEDKPCAHQTAEKVQNYLVALLQNQIQLSKAEKLMLVNNPPTTPLEIQLVVEESEERLSDEQKPLSKTFNKMSKSSVRQKRSLGKDSPLSKRPKLDFTLRPKEPLKGNLYDSKDSPKSCNGVVKDKNPDMPFGKTTEKTPQSASDWDEDFSGDMLEKVCLIADLSQAMVNNQSVPRDLDKEKINFEIFENSKVLPKPQSPTTPPNSPESTNKYLKLELERLQEKLKTKAGEVQILRSQLKQSEDAKQAVALQNIKVIEEIQKKCTEKISLTEKELESTKSKLLFRDLEYKTLSERCRQLEYSMSKNKLGDAINPTKPFAVSQTVQPKAYAKETNGNNPTVVCDNPEDTLVNLEFTTQSCHEGKKLANIICPEFFEVTNETSIVALHNFHSETDNQRAGYSDKREKYKWSNLPKQTTFIIDLYNSVSSLFTHNNFIHKDAQKTVQVVLDSCIEIITHQKQVLLFLEELQLCSDYDDADQSLLQNEEEVKMVTIKNLIDGKKLNEEECGIEGRRSLALIYALIKTSEVAFDRVKNNTNFINLLKSLATIIGNLRRPLRYSGILLGTSKILQKMLEEKKLTKESVALINETVEEIIFSRPKLDVLIEVINVLTAGKNHFDFLTSLCRSDSVDSCTLYMDCKLKQAMFFTKSACPLKLLCMQIMSLACLPSSKSLRWEITDCIIKWLNSSINTPFFSMIKWLPINSATRQEHCFNVTDCLLYLLTLCLKDYLGVFSQECFISENEVAEKKANWILIIAQGSVLLKRILKTDQRQLHDNTYSLRFAALLKAFLPAKSDLCQKTHLSHMSSLQVEAITWITEFLESDLRNQDCYLKHNTSSLSDIDFFNALKINDNPKVFSMG